MKKPLIEIWINRTQGGRIVTHVQGRTDDLVVHINDSTERDDLHAVRTALTSANVLRAELERGEQ